MKALNVHQIYCKRQAFGADGEAIQYGSETAIITQIYYGFNCNQTHTQLVLLFWVLNLKLYGFLIVINLSPMLLSFGIIVTFPYITRWKRLSLMK